MWLPHFTLIGVSVYTPFASERVLSCETSSDRSFKRDFRREYCSDKRLKLCAYFAPDHPMRQDVNDDTDIDYPTLIRSRFIQYLTNKNKSKIATPLG